ncbi:MAG TPA: sensor domain-containing phosphodiesterase, partial [Ktedonobacteraceae bacterium]|nr:sensor domain-containing phosphodiesterase [Ktedonobacteraceae bacterium]
TLVEEKRQWFKSVIGLAVRETARDVSFCAHAMLAQELFIIPDALADERFADNPDVLGGPQIRFYAGCPLYARDGSALGTFCIIDRQPRAFSSADQEVLRALGTWVEARINDINPPCEGESDVDRDATSESTERTTMLTMLQYQARHDPLTELANSLLLREKVEETLLVTAPGASCALLVLDFAHFKEVNTAFGYNQGNLLLLLISTRLCQVVGTSGMPARLSGNRFAILLPQAGEEKAAAVVQALLKAFEQPFTIAGIQLQLTASIGAAFSPQHGNSGEALLRRADVAMYEARRAGTAYAFYDVSFDQYGPSRLALSEALRQAIANDTLQLYYQPKADSKTGAVHSVEALARWYHPAYGFVPPDQFIPLAEQTGLIAQLTLCVLKQALRQCQSWRAAGYEIAVAVNFSMWNLRDSSLPDTIAALLQAYAVPASLLCVELTETAIMTDVERTVEVLHRLSALGVCLSIDDFGTGYSSLAYLRLLPINEVKIDRSFTQNLSSNETDAAIICSIVSLAHHLNLRVVAEGVEDQDTWDQLAACGCDVIQGYHLSRPLPATNLEQWLRARHTSAPSDAFPSLV